MISNNCSGFSHIDVVMCIFEKISESEDFISLKDSLN